MTITSAHLGSPSNTWTDTRLLYALEEVVEQELNRHLKVAKDWMPRSEEHTSELQSDVCSSDLV